MAKEATLFKELDHLYEEARIAKDLLEEAKGGDNEKLKDILRNIIEIDMHELNLLNAAMQHIGHKITAHEKKAMAEIIKFTGLLYIEINSALVDLSVNKLNKISWLLDTIIAEIEQVHQLERTPLEKLSTQNHVKIVRILAGLENTRFQLNKLKLESKAAYGRCIEKKIKFTNHNYPLVRRFKRVLKVDLKEQGLMQLYIYVIHCYIDYLDYQLIRTMQDLMEHKKLTEYRNGINVAQHILTTYGAIIDMISLVSSFIDYFEVKHHNKLEGILKIIRRKSMIAQKKLNKLIDEYSIESDAYNMSTIKRYMESIEHERERYRQFKDWMLNSGRLRDGQIIVLIL